MAHKISYFDAKFISILFHPLLIPTWAYLLIAFQGNLMVLQIPQDALWLIGSMVFTISAVIPALIILLMFRLRIISSLSMYVREDRTGPVVIAALFFYLTYYMLNELQFAPVFGFYMLGASSLAIVGMFINFWWKISLHLIAFGGFTGALTSLASHVNEIYIFNLIVVVLLSGFVGYARLKLRAHQPSEVYAGFLLGFAFMYLIFLLIY